VPFEDPRHLPHHRKGRLAEPYDLPRQRRGVTPQMHGRYPDFDVLAHAHHWDEQTRAVVLARLQPPPYRYFDAACVRTLEPLCDAVTGQDGEPRIPVLRYVDERLLKGRGPGYRYAELADDGEVWRSTARALDEAASALSGCDFADLNSEDRLELVGRFAAGRLRDISGTMLPPRAWLVVSNAIVTAYYAHPWAWNEIGFGGPAYPQGYMRLGIDQREPWEGREAKRPAAEFPADVGRNPALPS
jgi:Gluconate 2-dehydrogenase subunit 3